MIYGRRRVDSGGPDEEGHGKRESEYCVSVIILFMLGFMIQ